MTTLLPRLAELAAPTRLPEDGRFRGYFPDTAARVLEAWVDIGGELGPARAHLELGAGAFFGASRVLAKADLAARPDLAAAVHTLGGRLGWPGDHALVHLVATPAPAERALAERVVLVAAKADPPWKTDGLAEVLALALRSVHDEVRQAAGQQLRTLAENGGDMRAAIPPLAAALTDESDQVALWAGWALHSAAVKGADLSPALSALEAVLRPPREGDRAGASRALSVHLRNTGAEPPLPEGASHRAELAKSDTPTADRSARACLACRAKRVVQLHYRESEVGPGRSSSHEEVKCLACGKYSVYREEYDDPYAYGDAMI